MGKPTLYMTTKWAAFIKKSTERPKLGHWSDMSLAPTDKFLLLFCEANRPYSFYEGIAVGICIQRPIDKKDINPDYDWYLVGRADRDTGVFNYTKCNPHWWMPLPAEPMERPDVS